MRIITLTYNQNIAVIFDKIAEQPFSIWFNSGQANSYQQKFDIISSFPYKTLCSNIKSSTITNIVYDDTLNIINTNQSMVEHSSEITPFSIVNSLIKNLNSQLANTCDHNIPFWHGAAGYFGYDLNQLISTKLNIQHDDTNIPIMAVGIYAWALIYDHARKEAYIAYEPNHISSEQITYLIENFLEINNSQAQASESISNNFDEIELKTFFKIHKFVPEITYSTYADNFNKIKDHIKQGDSYQINYAVPFKLNIESINHTSWQVYQYLVAYNNNPFGCYFKINNNLSILSFSPERFLKVDNKNVTTMPIKGTRRKIADITKNTQLIEDLISNPKDRAENIMITDLLRNDLNKYCNPGTVLTPKVCELQTFPTVHHLVSTVTGVLKDDINSIDLMQGCFPGGSITGTPKIRAMQIIQEIENPNNELSRYIYCGSIGYINCNHNSDTNIAIRTILQKNHDYLYWAGSGIVADSVCEQEFNEILDKLIKTY